MSNTQGKRISRWRAGVAGVLALVAVLSGPTAAFAHGGVKDSGIRTFVVTGNTYATFAQAAVWGSTGTGVTYTGFNRGSTPNQYAASRARVFDEFGLWCQSGTVFSSYPNGATAYACAVPGGFSFYSQGIAYGFNTQAACCAWAMNYTPTTEYTYSDHALGTLLPPAKDMSASTWPRNDSGQTYGNAARAITPEDEPDLIAATAGNGARGYVLKGDLDAASGGDILTATTHHDIDTAMAAFDQRSDHDVEVYALDGRTRLGVMTVVGTDAQAEVAAALR